MLSAILILAQALANLEARTLPTGAKGTPTTLLNGASELRLLLRGGFSPHFLAMNFKRFLKRSLLFLEKSNFECPPA